MQPPFEYDGHALAALRSSLSAERLQRYESIAAGDASQALRLYVWNTALSESFYGPIQGLEVTLRNKIHERLAHPFGPCWYEDARVALQWAERYYANERELALKTIKELDEAEAAFPQSGKGGPTKIPWPTPEFWYEIEKKADAEEPD